MATGKVNTSIVGKDETVEHIALSDIDFDPKFNSRSTPTGFVSQRGEDGVDTEDSEESNYSKNFLSIALKGQDTPIIVRPHPNKDSRKRYSCVTGFTRGAIIAELASLSPSEAKLVGDEVEGSPLINSKNPTIKAIVRKLSEAEAQELNVRENSARKNPLAPDMAFGIYRIKRANPARSDQSIADSLGLSQPYVSRLNKIMGTLSNKVLDHWRNAAKNGQEVLDTHVMHGFSKLDKNDQDKAYFDAVSAKEAKGEESEKGQNRWIDSALEKSEAMGTLLGSLVREGMIQCDTAAIDMIQMLVPLKRKDVKQAHWNRFAARCEKAYEKAVSAPTNEEREAEAEEAKAAGEKEPKGKGKGKNGVAASAS